MSVVVAALLLAAWCALCAFVVLIALHRMSLPEPRSPRETPRFQRPVVFAAVFGGGIALVISISGLVLLGMTDEGDAQIASTGLATIGATLAGAFAAWMGGRDRRTDDHPPMERHDD